MASGGMGEPACSNERSAERTPNPAHDAAPRPRDAAADTRVWGCRPPTRATRPQKGTARLGSNEHALGVQQLGSDEHQQCLLLA